MLSGFVLDEHLRRRLWRAIQAHNARGVDPLDVVRVGDLPDLPLGSSDAAILLWAERHARILVSLDRSTMAGHLAEHLQAGRHCPGIFSIRLRSNPAEVIEHLVLATYASDPGEWRDWINYIP
jgi:hypothetical protein